MKSKDSVVFGEEVSENKQRSRRSKMNSKAIYRDLDIELSTDNFATTLLDVLRRIGKGKIRDDEELSVIQFNGQTLRPEQVLPFKLLLKKTREVKITKGNG